MTIIKATSASRRSGFSAISPSTKAVARRRLGRSLIDLLGTKDALAIVNARMMGERASINFSSPEEISCFIVRAC
jgi:hypothetical protein